MPWNRNDPDPLEARRRQLAEQERLLSEQRRRLTEQSQGSGASGAWKRMACPHASPIPPLRANEISPVNASAIGFFSSFLSPCSSLSWSLCYGLLTSTTPPPPTGL